MCNGVREDQGDASQKDFMESYPCGSEIVPDECYIGGIV
jgi:hypothetical protein